MQKRGIRFVVLLAQALQLQPRVEYPGGLRRTCLSEDEERIAKGKRDLRRQGVRRQEAPKLGHVTPSNLLLIHHSCPQGEKTNKSAQTHLPKGGIRIESFTDDANDSNNSALLHSTLLPLYPLFFLSEEFRFLPYFAFRFYLRLSLLNVKSESLEGICRYYVRILESFPTCSPTLHHTQFGEKKRGILIRTRGLHAPAGPIINAPINYRRLSIHACPIINVSRTNYFSPVILPRLSSPLCIKSVLNPY